MLCYSQLCVIHYNNNNIIIIVCHESCATCSTAMESTQCLSCPDGHELVGPAPSACSHTGNGSSPENGSGDSPSCSG